MPNVVRKLMMAVGDFSALAGVAEVDIDFSDVACLYFYTLAPKTDLQRR